MYGGNQTYSSNGVTFDYPEGWYKTPGQGNVNVFGMLIPVIVIAGDHADEETGVIVLLASNTTSGEISSEIIKAAIQKFGVLMFEDNITVNNAPAYEFVYNTTLPDGTVKKERLILFKTITLNIF